MKILFVCTGNLCRSPMAEAMLRDALARRGCDGIEVASSGTWAFRGSDATPDAIEVLGSMGVALRDHRSRAIDAAEVAEADLVVCMTSVHTNEILSLAPDVADRLVLLKEIPEIEMLQVWPEATRRDRLAALLGGKRPKRRRSLDLDDPMGLPRSAYERCAKEIRTAIEAFVDRLCGEGTRS